MLSSGGLGFSSALLGSRDMKAESSWAWSGEWVKVVRYIACCDVVMIVVYTYKLCQLDLSCSLPGVLIVIVIAYLRTYRSDKHTRGLSS